MTNLLSNRKFNILIDSLECTFCALKKIFFYEKQTEYSTIIFRDKIQIKYGRLSTYTKREFYDFLNPKNGKIVTKFEKNIPPL